MSEKLLAFVALRFKSKATYKSLILILILPMFGCRATGTLSSSVPATVSSLDEQFKATGQLGQVPIAIESGSATERYVLESNTASSEYLFIIDPQKVQGTLNIPLASREVDQESAVVYHPYLDQLLRIHRFVLRGELQEALGSLDQLDERYQPSYGSLVLRGNVYFIAGDLSESQRYFDLAQRIYPGAKALKGLQP